MKGVSPPGEAGLNKGSGTLFLWPYPDLRVTANEGGAESSRERPWLVLPATKDVAVACAYKRLHQNTTYQQIARWYSHLQQTICRNKQSRVSEAANPFSLLLYHLQIFSDF